MYGNRAIEFGLKLDENGMKTLKTSPLNISWSVHQKIILIWWPLSVVNGLLPLGQAHMECVKKWKCEKKSV